MNSLPEIRRLAAFSHAGRGGNPAGVVLAAQLPDAGDMQRIARDVGYSETAFAAPERGGHRVRYFSPETEVPFCGHATIALGAALAADQGAGCFDLFLNNADIRVEAETAGPFPVVTLTSPPTHSSPAPGGLTRAALDLFGYEIADLDPSLPPTCASAGAAHLILALKDRRLLSAMSYDLGAGRALMRSHGLVTIALVVAEGPRLFHVRNAFASGGVVEDPATGAAAAALAGALRAAGWPHGNDLEILQGADMGSPSRLRVTLTDDPGTPVRVSGQVRLIEA